MDFSYSEEQRLLQDQVRRFVQKSYDFDTRNRIIQSEAGYSPDNWRLFAEQGWLALPFAVEDGGLGGSAVDLMVMMEEFGRGNLVEPFIATVLLGGGLISELAEGEQRTQLLERLVKGELQLACAYAETGSRFNPASVAATASPQNDASQINGSKIGVLNGSNADYILTVARTAGGETDSSGIGVFLVDPRQPGVSIRGFSHIDGIRSSEISFKDASIAGCIAPDSDALPALQRTLDRATVGVCAEAVGALDSLLEKTVEYSKTRKQFGTVIGTFQALQHRMADMFIECQLARSIVVMAAMRLDSSATDLEKTRAVSAAKSRVGKAIRHVGQEAIQIHGGIGMTDELDVGHLFKRVTAIEILFGNTDYHTERFASLG